MVCNYYTITYLVNEIYIPATMATMDNRDSNVGVTITTMEDYT